MTKAAGELIAEAVAMCIIIAMGDSVAAMYNLYDPSPYQTGILGSLHRLGSGRHHRHLQHRLSKRMPRQPRRHPRPRLLPQFSWRKVVPYCAAQVLGGFLGATIVYALFSPVIDAFNGAHHLTRAAGGAAGVFFTHPGSSIVPLHAFTDEIILTAFLVFGIFAITEQYNEQAPGANSGALIIGFLVATIGASMGYLEAWAINPARDFGPRLFCFFAGWSSSALPSPGNYWWIPIVAPLLGGVAGGGAYQVLIHQFLPARNRARAVRPLD